MPSCAEAYLDIETTGLSPSGCDITVIGIHLCRRDDADFVHLVGKDLTADSVLDALNGCEAVKLWWKYVDTFDLDALNRLLEYNKEDVLNLKTLKDMLLRR